MGKKEWQIFYQYIFIVFGSRLINKKEIKFL